jgi:hypothetical protein
MDANAVIGAEGLREGLARIRGPSREAPDAAVVFPVNAQGDLENVRVALADVVRYRGERKVEVVTVVNNYPEGQEPPEVRELRGLGCRVVAEPSLRVPGEAPGLSARIRGVREASAEKIVLFDADCRIPNATGLIDWYVDQLEAGASAAYTHVAYFDYAPLWAIRVRFAVHHSARWFKRVVLRIPTIRGSNYACRRAGLLEFYDAGLVADDMNVGPVVKASGGRIAYSGDRRLRVLTSGRMFSGNWRSLIPYYAYRLAYNLRVLRVRPDAARHTGREKDPIRRYVDGRPVEEAPVEAPRSSRGS